MGSTEEEKEAASRRKTLPLGGRMHVERNTGVGSLLEEICSIPTT